jgi:hypothetical protein
MRAAPAGVCIRTHEKLFRAMERAPCSSQSVSAVTLASDSGREANCFGASDAQPGGVAIAYELNFNYVTGHATFMAGRGSGQRAPLTRGAQLPPKAEIHWRPLAGDAVNGCLSPLRTARIT